MSLSGAAVIAGPGGNVRTDLGRAVGTIRDIYGKITIREHGENRR